jgi:hypothetical protein
MLPGLRGGVCVECAKYTSTSIFTHSLPLDTHPAYVLESWYA